MKFRGSTSTFTWLRPLCALALPYLGLSFFGLSSGCAKINRPWMDGGADSGIDAVGIDAPDRDSNGMDVLPDRIVDEAGRDSELMDQGLMDLGVSDIGVTDSGGMDLGTTDLGTLDSGPADSGFVDSGPMFPPPDCGALGAVYSPADATIAGSIYRACLPNSVSSMSASAAQSFCESATGWRLVSIGSVAENLAVQDLACPAADFECVSHSTRRVAVPLRVRGGRWHRAADNVSACTNFFAFANATNNIESAGIGQNSSLYTTLCGTTMGAHFCRCLNGYGANDEVRSQGFWPFPNGRPDYPDGMSDTVVLCLQQNPNSLNCAPGQWANARREELLPYAVVCERQ